MFVMVNLTKKNHVHVHSLTEADTEGAAVNLKLCKKNKLKVLTIYYNF